MTKGELEAIRKRVDEEEPQGSLARLLLAELDRLYTSIDQQSAAQVRYELMANDHLTEVEADKVLALFRSGKTADVESGRCRACKGERVHGYWCTKCDGTGVTVRIKIPD